MKLNYKPENSLHYNQSEDKTFILDRTEKQDQNISLRTSDYSTNLSLFQTAYDEENSLLCHDKENQSPNSD